VPLEAFAPVTDVDRHFRRAVWIAALITTIGACLVYADKAADDRSAFIRWRHQVLDFWDGVNIYDTMMFPNPPIFPITLYPLAVLPKVQGAVCWFVLKAALTAVSIWLCFRIARPPGTRTLPSWVQGPVLLLSLRPILSDLHHANNNLLIMFLVVAALQSWRNGYDVLAGLILALAISYKVTPALFMVYLAYKRSWRTVGATFLGMGIYLLIVPSLVLGPTFNGICLATWWQRMLSPFLVKDYISPQEINQSLGGVLTRLLIESKTGVGRYELHLKVNVVSWSPTVVTMLVKVLSASLVVLLAVLCRTQAKRRDDPRLLGEFALVVLTMLFVSERSWKHHYVTVLLPYTYLMYRVGMPGPGATTRVRSILAGAMALSAILMATTSTEIGRYFAGGEGHKLAQGYGMFFWAGFVLYVATAWRVWVEKTGSKDDIPEEGPVSLGRSSPAPHWAGRMRPIVPA
jgi:hypothetical protein